MRPSSKLVFFGTEDFSLPSLRALVEHGFEIAAVVTKPNSARGRSKQLVEPIVKAYAREQNIPVLQPEKLGEITNELSQLGASAAVLVSYGKLLPQRTLDVFIGPGIINVHPSLLPKYRGPAPIEAAILAGDKTTGITLMQLTAGMDEGPIYTQTPYALTGTETKPELTKRLAEVSAAFLVEHLPSILSGELEPVAQQNNGVSYTTLLSKPDGIMDPTTDTAPALERKVRAYLGYPKSRLRIKNNDVIITSSKVVESLTDYPLVVPCAGSTYLALLQVTAPSGKSMTGEAYVRGYGNEPLAE